MQLHLTPGAAEGLLSLAHDLAVKLPRTSVALRDGIIDLDKARTIAWYCFALSAAEARAAEKILLGLAGVEEMTWGMIRDRIARAVIEVNPEAARRRREQAARDKRVEVLAEQSGNCQLAGRELPPAAVLAASENMTARALQLRAAGVPGGMDELRALAYLEALGGLDPLDCAAAGVPRGADPGDGTGGTGGGTGEGTDDGPGSGGDGGKGGKAGRRARPAGPAARRPRYPRQRGGRGARGDPGGVRGAGEPDHPAGHAAGAGRAARDAVPDRAGRPRAGPGPGRRRGPQPPLHLVRDRHRPGSPARRPRLRPPPAPPRQARHRRPRRAALYPR